MAKEPSRLEKTVGCFLGVVIGNALGVPWKTMKAKEIKLATRGKGIAGFSNPVQLKLMDIRALESGEFTDSWRLTRAVAVSLIAKNGFDLTDCVVRHLIELDDSEAIGFDVSTKLSLLAIKNGAAGDWRTNSNFHLPKTEELENDGSSNGVAVKISPLALFYHDRPQYLFDTLKLLAGLTHRDPQAMVSAYILGALIIQLYQRSIGLGTKEQLDQEIRELVKGLISECIVLEGAVFNGRRTQFIQRMMELGKLVYDNKLADIDLTAKTLGTGSYCAESVPFSIAMFLRCPTDFRGCLIQTINCGGDTDSNAAMAGALLGANLGPLAIPEDWRNFRPEYREVAGLGSQFYKLLLKPTRRKK